MSQIAPPIVRDPAVPPAPVSAAPLVKPPPVSAAPAAKKSPSPVVWIVALALGAMGIGAMFVLLLVVGVAALVMLKAKPAGPPAVSAPPAMSAPRYSSGSSDYGTSPQPAGLSSTPSTSGDTQDAYRQPNDPDWQFNLPEAQRDAIRELNREREERQQREEVRQRLENP